MNEAQNGSNSRERRHFSPAQKVAIVKRHLVDGVPISDLCEEHQLVPTQFYQWQKQLFENGTAAFERKNKPAGPSPQQRQIELDLLGREGDPVDDGVEPVLAERAPRRLRIADVAGQHLDLERHRAAAGAAAAQVKQVDPARHGQPRARRADDARATDEQNLHVFSLPRPDAGQSRA